MPNSATRPVDAARPIVVWFRDDLRVADHPALAAAAASGRPVVALYVLEEGETGMRPLGGAAKWWLHHSLRALEGRLASLGRRGASAPRLVMRRGDASRHLREICAMTAADRVVWNRAQDPVRASRDERVEQVLRRAGVTVDTFPGDWLVAPETLGNASGEPYKVFSAFWNRLSAQAVPPPVSAPRALAGATVEPASDSLEAWRLLPRIPWDAGLADTWTPGERGAHARLRAFLSRGLPHYRSTRDFPGVAGTSGLSPHLRWGEISPRALWHAALSQSPRGELTGHGFLRELGWREFARHLLKHTPSMPERPLRAQFESFRWEDDPESLAAWQRGLTGYPIVDAGMRELWHTGWMHNRVRMIVASFLVKDLLLPWRHGESWFWDTLVDADRASNAMNWQWVAGCGVDAAPYFRIFNPVAQSERFDPEGRYLRKWLPPLKALPARYRHAPWQAPQSVLARAGVRLGETYPRPIVDHAEARRRALERFAACRAGARGARGAR